ncbi:MULTISPECIES: hypothetical protein [unclassified Streptomyces]|uniref:Uncharacterized protein n=1 Tax=Streptomyces sp. NBC_00060 TaxID=2975636 RepID=A0AAU2GSH7_9ACTN
MTIDSEGAVVSGMGRRAFTKALSLGVMTSSVGLATATDGEAVTAPAGRTASRRAQRNVNLFCRVASSATTDESGNCTAVITCGNFGPDDAVGPVSLKFITPFFLNVSQLPEGATWLYQNEDPAIPSIIQVKFSGIQSGVANAKTVSVPMKLAPGAPNRLGVGRVIFTTDATNTTDTDTDLTRNARTVPVIRSVLAPAPPIGTANLYFTINQRALIAGGNAEKMPFSFYNGAGKLLQGTKDPALFTFYTPFHASVPAQGRPAGLTELYRNDDPAIPSVYQLRIPAGLGVGGAAVPKTVGVPFAADADAPLGPLYSSGIVLPTGRDTQGDQSTTFRQFELFSVRPGAV